MARLVYYRSAFKSRRRLRFQLPGLMRRCDDNYRALTTVVDSSPLSSTRSKTEDYLMRISETRTRRPFSGLFLFSRGEKMKKTCSVALLCLAVLSFACVPLVAQGVASHPQSAHVTPSKDITPAQKVPAGSKIIFSNLGSATNAYYIGNGWLVAGPDSILGDSQFIALPFTPTADSTVTEIDTAVGYDASGTNQFDLELASDSSGSVGTVMARTIIKNTPTFGTCCELNRWKLATPVSVTAGTQYWIVAVTANSGTGDDFYGVWAFSVVDNFEYNVAGDGWTSGIAFGGIPAGRVVGTIP